MKQVLAVVIAVIAMVSFGLSGRKERKQVPELTNVNSIFVSGNNAAALKAREMIREGKTCFTLAVKVEEADAVLEMVDTPNAGRDTFGSTVSAVSATLTLKNGILIWADDCRFSSAPFMNPSKAAASTIIGDLCAAADCKHRK